VATLHHGSLQRHCATLSSFVAPDSQSVRALLCQGLLSGKTRLLVTHQLQYLPDCDRVVVMEEGRIAHVGTYTELTRAGVDFTALIPQAETPSATADGAAEAALEAEAAAVAAAAAAASGAGAGPGAEPGAEPGHSTGDDEHKGGDAVHATAVRVDVQAAAAALATPAMPLSPAALVLRRGGAGSFADPAPPTSTEGTPKESGTPKAPEPASPLAGAPGSKIMTREHRVEGAVTFETMKVRTLLCRCVSYWVRLLTLALCTAEVLPRCRGLRRRLRRGRSRAVLGCGSNRAGLLGQLLGPRRAVYTGQASGSR
jgi:hypothetical protein